MASTTLKFNGAIQCLLGEKDFTSLQHLQCNLHGVYIEPTTSKLGVNPQGALT